MEIGRKLRELRTTRKLSQGDIEKRTGLLRCYVSRVENGHTIPNVDTLEKYARALETPLHELFYDGDVPGKIPALINSGPYFGAGGKERSELKAFAEALSKMDDFDRGLLVGMAQRIADLKGSRKK